MARTRNPEIVKRNHQLYAEWQRGASLTALGDKYGISRQAAGRIVASFHPEDEEDLDRSLYRGHLWRLFDEVRDIYAEPGWKMSPTGVPASGPDGEPAEDVMVKIEAAKLQLGVLESLRKLDGRDKPVKKDVHYTVDVAQQQATEDIARRRAEIEQERRELEELRRAARPPVVQATAETVRELPPGT